MPTTGPIARWGPLWPVLSALVAGGAAWGVSQQRIEQLEAQLVALDVMRTTAQGMDVRLSRIEERLAGREDGAARLAAELDRSSRLRDEQAAGFAARIDALEREHADMHTLLAVLTEKLSRIEQIVGTVPLPPPSLRGKPGGAAMQ